MTLFNLAEEEEVPHNIGEESRKKVSIVSTKLLFVEEWSFSLLLQLLLKRGCRRFLTLSDDGGRKNADTLLGE